MSPETKEVLDYVVMLAGGGSLGGIVLAMFGFLKAKAEKPHIASSSHNGGAALAQFGGMVMGQQLGQDLVDALRGNAAAHDRCTLVREAELQQRKKLAEEQREFLKRQADALHDDNRALVDELGTLNGRLRDVHLTK